MRRASIGSLMLLVVSLLWAVPAQARTQPELLRVGLQVGHWRSNELPDELRQLRGSTGAAAAGLQEYQVNLEMAQRTAGFLRGAGIAVDILPATVPVNYYADAFVALHADGNANTRLSGFKAAANWREWEASMALVAALRTDYTAASGLAWDGDHISMNMRGYYAMSSGRYQHTISNYTPAVILEVGYLTSPYDRALMTQQTDRLARGVANGIVRFLQSKPSEGWPAPPPLPAFRGIVIAQTANVRSGPGTNYPVVRVVNRNRMLLVDEVRGDWLKLSRWRASQGERWIRRDTVRLERISDEPPQDS